MQSVDPMDDVIVDIQKLLVRIRKIERRITTDTKLVRAVHRAARMVQNTLRESHVN